MQSTGLHPLLLIGIVLFCAGLFGLGVLVKRKQERDTRYPEGIRELLAEAAFQRRCGDVRAALALDYETSIVWLERLGENPKIFHVDQTLTVLAQVLKLCDEPEAATLWDVVAARAAAAELAAELDAASAQRQVTLLTTQLRDTVANTCVALRAASSAPRRAS